MNWLLKLFNQESKPLLYCVHGFGVRRSHEYDTLRAYFEPLGYTIEAPLLFDQTQLDDIDAKQWIARAEEPLKELFKSNPRIILIGFSMGGVIASELARRYPVERLVLIAPGFEYITVKAVIETVGDKARQILRLPDNVVVQGEYPELPDHFTNTFRDVVAKCKESIAQVHCPVLIFHGTSDQTIPVRSSDYAYDQIPHKRKRLFILKNVPHRILDEKDINQDVFKIMHEFFLGSIIQN